MIWFIQYDSRKLVVWVVSPPFLCTHCIFKLIHCDVSRWFCHLPIVWSTLLCVISSRPLGAKKLAIFLALFTGTEIQADRYFRLFEEIKDCTRRQLTDNAAPVCSASFYLVSVPALGYSHFLSLILSASLFWWGFFSSPTLGLYFIQRLGIFLCSASPTLPFPPPPPPLSVCVSPLDMRTHTQTCLAWLHVFTAPVIRGRVTT